MMKKYFAMAAVATMFAACTNEDVTPQVDAMTGMPIVVKTNIASPVSSRVTGMDSEGDLSLFYLDIQGTNEGDTDYFVQMMNDEGWKSVAYDENLSMYATPCNMVWANSNDVTVSAFCGGAAVSVSNPDDWSNPLPVPVNYNQSNADSYKNSDFLYMPPTTVTPSAEGITVNFQHLMSKVTISIASGESEATEVKVGGTYQVGEFSPSRNTWDFTKTDISFIRDITACKDSYVNGNSVYEAILVPQTVSSGFAVSFKIGDVTYKWTSDEEVILESGKHYTINLTVPADPTGEAILLEKISIAEWDSETTPMGGEATKQ